MILSRSKSRRLIKYALFLIFAGIIVGYAILGSMTYFRGPEIIIFYPHNGLSTASSTIEISGQALRINKISLNGRPILIDQNGNWKEVLAIFKGMNKISIEASDQFGRSKKILLDIAGL
jgi:hypothetical protein